MSSLQTLVSIFKATPTLANAKKVVAKNTHHPMAICTLLADDAVEVAKAIRLVEDAKNPAKFEEAMQRELQARFKSPNIIFVKA
jgi:hypothetical protein